MMPPYPAVDKLTTYLMGMVGIGFIVLLFTHVDDQVFCVVSLDFPGQIASLG